MRLVSGWRLALRLAWRDALRAKGRSVLVLVMVTFPVVAVVAADVAQATASVSSVEGLDRRLGTAEARVQTLPDTRSVAQDADPDSGGYVVRSGQGDQATLAAVVGALGGGSLPATELDQGVLDLRTDVGVLQVGATGIDVTDPLTQGLFRLTSGRLPRSADEVAVNAALGDQGYAVGDTLTTTKGRSLRVVGTAESAGDRTDPLVLGAPGLLPVTPGSTRTWLVGGAPVTWDQVRAANALGAVVLSRQVIEHPPSKAELPAQFRSGSGDKSQLYAVLVLIGVMALLEVVLLAGPAFAVGARRQSRALALIAANGGNPRQSRRVVLASAVVLGTVGSVVGLVLGIGVARLVMPSLQRMQSTYFGPFQLRWPHLLGIAAFGLISALLAAVVPAWVASRQDVVAVLAGRRGDRAASRRSPIVGVVLLAAGIVAAVLGSRQDGGDFLIAGAAVVSVIGMIFLVPVVVLGVARLGRRLPLPLRYAVRDASRHRTRTVPAVAAVAATVAGVVALSIANHSDQAQAKAQYEQLLPKGDAVAAAIPPGKVPAMRAALHEQLPGVRITAVDGMAGRGSTLAFRAPGRGRDVQVGYSSILGSDVLVGATGLGNAVHGDVLTQAQATLRRGGAVVFDSRPESARTVQVSVRGPQGRRTVSVPATYVDVGEAHSAPMRALVSPAVPRRLGVDPRRVGLYLPGAHLSSAEQDQATQVVRSVAPAAFFYAEDGYQVPGAEKVVLWILFVMGAVLMLGGTLTATFLALSDARPDLATLSAVGASPRTRRGVAAAYALAVGLVGAVLGAAVGFIPGIAITYPLTRTTWDPTAPSHYLDIPWLQIVLLVVALPLVTAAVVGLMARSRLPVVARLD
jgi:putative ABC transport system permease protein